MSKKDTQAAELSSEEMTLEQAFAKMDELIAVLENNETPLEAAFAAYQEGMKLVRSSSEKIDLVEKKVLKMNEEGETVDF